MHEMAVTQSLLEMSVNKAREAGSTAITQINLVIGDLSSVLDESVQFYFNFISKGTLADGARLNFKRIRVLAKCRQCQTEFNPGGENWKCPHCNDPGIDIIAGNEFYLESIEVE